MQDTLKRLTQLDYLMCFGVKGGVLTFPIGNIVTADLKEELDEKIIHLEILPIDGNEPVVIDTPYDDNDLEEIVNDPECIEIIFKCGYEIMFISA